MIYYLQEIMILIYNIIIRREIGTFVSLFSKKCAIVMY